MGEPIYDLPKSIPACETVEDLLVVLRGLPLDLPLSCGMGDGVQPTISKEVGCGRNRLVLSLEEVDEDDLDDEDEDDGECR